MTMKETVLAFIDRINAHDVDGVIDLMAEDYKFVNSAGDTFQGREMMRDTWREQFKLYPDFKIKIQQTVADEHGVGIFGMSLGTYSPPDGHVDEENHWEVPAAFLGIARNGKMTYWQTWSDSSWVFDIIEANEEEQSHQHPSCDK
jgi:ketosteroid isomerase-like protein